MFRASNECVPKFKAKDALVIPYYDRNVQKISYTKKKGRA